MVKQKEALDVKTAEDVAMEVEYEFAWRRKWADFLIALLNRLTAFLFLRVLMRYFLQFLSLFVILFMKNTISFLYVMIWWRKVKPFAVLVIVIIKICFFSWKAY